MSMEHTAIAPVAAPISPLRRVAHYAGLGGMPRLFGLAAFGTVFLRPLAVVGPDTDGLGVFRAVAMLAAVGVVLSFGGKRQFAALPISNRERVVAATVPGALGAGVGLGVLWLAEAVLPLASHHSPLGAVFLGAATTSLAAQWEARRPAALAALPTAATAVSCGAAYLVGGLASDLGLFLALSPTWIGGIVAVTAPEIRWDPLKPWTEAVDSSGRTTASSALTFREPMAPRRRMLVGGATRTLVMLTVCAGFSAFVGLVGSVYRVDLYGSTAYLAVCTALLAAWLSSFANATIWDAAPVGARVMARARWIEAAVVHAVVGAAVTGWAWSQGASLASIGVSWAYLIVAFPTLAAVIATAVFDAHLPAPRRATLRSSLVVVGLSAQIPAVMVAWAAWSFGLDVLGQPTGVVTAACMGWSATVSAVAVALRAASRAS